MTRTRYRVVKVCNPSTWEVEARRLEGEGQPGLYNELEASLGHETRPEKKKLERKKRKEKKGDLFEHL